MIEPRVEDIRPVSDELVQLNDPGHVYTVGGGLTEREAPSLSRVLASAGLQTDYSCVDPDHLAFRSSVGTLTHDWILSYWKGGAFGRGRNGDDRFVAMHAEPHMEAFLAWIKGHELVPAFVESPAYQPILKYACMEDFIGIYDGEYSVIDWKTTYKISKTVSLQTMGQARCFEVMGEGHAFLPFKRYALHLPKKGKAKLVPFTDDDYAMDTLAAAATCWNAKAKYLA